MHDRAAKTGVLCGVAAYLSWGLFPIYFKALKQVDASEILCHRIVWSAVFLAVLMAVRGRWGEVAAALRDRRVILTLAGSTVLIAINWFTYILANLHNHVLQASLGYFINPLVNVLLGYVFLGERLRPWQKASVALAAGGVLLLTVSYGQIPSIALILAGSFGLYGLVRKMVKVEAMAGLTIETVLLAPLAAGWMAYLAAGGRLSFGHASNTVNGLLLLAGVVTSVPLLWFTIAARRLRLSTLGFLQYLSPTGHFLLGVLAYSEPFGRADAVAFGLIWAGLAIYSVDTLRRR